MAVNIESLFEQAKSLSEFDRAELANRLYDTLPALPELPIAWQSEDEAEAAWKAELHHRLDDVANGTADCIPWDQALAEAREQLRRKHGR